jgi:hypothetical protein
MGLQPYPVKKKIVEKPPRNSARFFGGGQGLSWAVEPREEEQEQEASLTVWIVMANSYYKAHCHIMRDVIRINCDRRTIFHCLSLTISTV